jgi:hypothetical protein
VGINVCDELKGKAVPQHTYGSAGGRLCRSYSFMTSALLWGKRSASRPGRVLPPWKGPPVPIGQEAGWASELVWTQRLEEGKEDKLIIFLLCNCLHPRVTSSILGVSTR